MTPSHDQPSPESARLPSGDETGPDLGSRREVPCRVPYTQVHARVRRTFENLQDVTASLLMVLLFLLSLQALGRLAWMAFWENASPTDVLSEVIFVLILMELYRLLIFYLREHRVSVALAVEVALVSTLREKWPRERTTSSVTRRCPCSRPAMRRTGRPGGDPQ